MWLPFFGASGASPRATHLQSRHCPLRLPGAPPRLTLSFPGKLDPPLWGPGPELQPKDHPVTNKAERVSPCWASLGEVEQGMRRQGGRDRKEGEVCKGIDGTSTSEAETRTERRGEWPSCVRRSREKQSREVNRETLSPAPQGPARCSATTVLKVGSPDQQHRLPWQPVRMHILRPQPSPTASDTVG